MAKSILLAEDSLDDIFIFKQVLQKSGLLNPLIIVGDGDEAISYLRGDGDFADRVQYPLPVILLLDLKMPKVNGFQVLQWLGTQSHLKDLLVVVLSHFGDTKEIREAYSLGAHTFLTKPITQTELLNLSFHFNTYWERDPAANETRLD